MWDVSTSPPGAKRTLVLKPAGKRIMRPKRVVHGARVGGVTDVVGAL
jgi:hypothetical protein